MTETGPDSKPIFILAARGSLINIGWNLGNPSVVLTYMAVAHDMPIFLAGLLVNVRRVAFMMIDICGGAIVSRNLNRVVGLAATDVTIALCLLAVILAILFGSPAVVATTLILSVFGLGIASELEGLIYTDLIGRSVRSKDRTRLKYWGMGIGGLGTILLAWPIHILLSEVRPEIRHTTVVLAGIGCFCVAAMTLYGLRQLELRLRDTRRADRTHWRTELRNQFSHYRHLAAASWFRKLVIIRFALQTVQIAIPFLAITAAFTNAHSAHGITTLIMSSALALVVSAPLWNWFSRGSHRLVMVLACLLAAVSGLIVVGNYYWPVADPTLLHAVSLFGLTVAGKGVSSARSLYYLDVAPDADRVVGLATAKSLTRISGIALSIVLAAVAHLNHVIWAVAIIMVLNLIAAAVCMLVVEGRSIEAQPA